MKIKEQIIKSKPYKKNEAIEFWRRQRLQFKSPRKSVNDGNPEHLRSAEYDLKKTKKMAYSPSQVQLERLYGVTPTSKKNYVPIHQNAYTRRLSNSNSHLISSPPNEQEQYTDEYIKTLDERSVVNINIL